jgi:glycosyltransferase involved in cell wall biosynthesis
VGLVYKKSKIKMNILVISLDKEILKKSGQSETINRFKIISQKKIGINFIIPTSKKTKSFSISKINIIPAYGKNTLLSYFSILIKIVKICLKNKIDLILANDAVLGAIAIIARSIFKYKVQISVFGLEIFSKDWQKERIQNALLKTVHIWALKKADSIRTDNAKDKIILNEKLKIDKNKIVSIPVSINQKDQKKLIDRKRDLRFRQKLGGENQKILLSVGRLVKAKGFDVLINAAKEIIKQKNKNVKFIIIGDGSERKVLQEKINNFNLEKHIYLLGAVKHSQLIKYFHNCDLFILPSLYEGLPRVLMMAALSGLPIVSTDIDGVGELVKNQKSGLIVPINNFKKLSQALNFLIENPNISAKFASEARQNAIKVLNFDTNLNKLIKSWYAI